MTGDSRPVHHCQGPALLQAMDRFGIDKPDLRYDMELLGQQANQSMRHITCMPRLVDLTEVDLPQHRLARPNAVHTFASRGEQGEKLQGWRSIYHTMQDVFRACSVCLRCLMMRSSLWGCAARFGCIL